MPAGYVMWDTVDCIQGIELCACWLCDVGHCRLYPGNNVPAGYVMWGTVRI